MIGAKTEHLLPFHTVGFNPRTRDRCEAIGVISAIAVTVSIHAPVIGANLEI